MIGGWTKNVEIFRIHLKHIKCLNDVLLPSLSAKPTSQIINFGGYILRID